MVTSKEWYITYYNQNVFDAIFEMPLKIQAKYIGLTGEMETHGPNLGMPYTRPMGNGLFEIRIKAQEGIARVFYCTQINREIVILHSFIKKTEKTPNRELRIARKNLKEVQKNA